MDDFEILQRLDVERIHDEARMDITARGKATWQN
jgi:hypothetical protein